MNPTNIFLFLLVFAVGGFALAAFVMNYLKKHGKY